MYGHKSLILAHPTHGNLIASPSMLAFCEAQNIEEEYHEMVDLANGVIKEHQGWTLVQEGDSKVDNYANMMEEIGKERRANGLTMFSVN